MFTTTRHRTARSLRPTIDCLEGRELLSTLGPDAGGYGNGQGGGAGKASVAAPAIQGGHIGTNVAPLVGNGSFKVMVPAVVAAGRKM